MPESLPPRYRRLLLATVAVVLPAAAIVYSVLPSEAATTPTATGVYTLGIFGTPSASAPLGELRF